jgi:hypothetical protein
MVRCWGRYFWDLDAWAKSFILFFLWRGEGIVILCWGTHWEPKKNEKKSSPPGPSSQNLKGIKARHLECTLGPSIGCMKFLFPKEFVTF